MLKIGSYNIQKSIGLDARRRPERTLRVISEMNCDVIALQEVDKRFGPREATLRPEMIAELTDYKPVPLAIREGSIGWHGNAMLIAPNVAVIRTARFDLPGLEPRGAIRVELDTAIGPLRVMGVHLGLVKRYRLLQLAAITRTLRTLPDMPTVVAGDFNDWGKGWDLDAQVPGLRFVAPAPSFPSPRPVAALDRFLISDELRAVSGGVHVRRPARIASDHLPVWVDLARA